MASTLQGTVFESCADEFEKIASSKLRALVKVVPGRRTGEWRLMLGEKRIGRMLLDSADDEAANNIVKLIKIDPEFRGMGLGKKFQGEVARRLPRQQVHVQTPVSDSYRRVIESAPKRGYEVSSVPSGAIAPTKFLAAGESVVGSRLTGMESAAPGIPGIMYSMKLPGKAAK